MEIDLIKEIREVELEIKEGELPNDLALIKQTSIVWYLLVEGNNEIVEDQLQQTLDRNMILINKFYPKDPDLLFLRGWMMKISPWYFKSGSDEVGDKYLRSAYKHAPHNLLYKWALSEMPHTIKTTAERLDASVLENLDEYYINYKPIQEYFKNIVGKR